MKIKVTRTHIYEGQRKNCHLCPVALAVQEASGSDFVFVSLHDILCGRKEYTISEVVKNFILDFDAGCPVKPFEFELPIE